MKLYTVQLFTLLSVIVYLTACSTSPVPRTGMMNAIDTTMGSYHKHQDKELILLTMDNAEHGQLINGQSITEPDSLPPQYLEFLQTLADQHQLERVADWPLSSLGIRCFVFQSDRPLTLESLKAIENIKQVESVQYLQIFNTTTSSYNDPLIELQKGFTSMNIEPSHRWATGKGVKIAVIDTGIDYTHRDLKNRIHFKQNFVDKNDSSFVNDIHGTAIAGVIASNVNNSEGLVGIAPEVDIYALKSCWYEQDNPNQAYCNSFTLAKALNKSIAENVDVINLSLGGPADTLLQRLVEKAMQNNILVIGATHPQFETSFPASVPGVIAVSEKQGEPAQNNTARPVIVSAENVVSTRPENKYDFYSGSSISTAQITGIVALIRQRQPHLAQDEIHELLFKNQSGNKSINACNILSSLVGADDCN